MRSSGTPTTAACAIAGCASSSFSISAGIGVEAADDEHVLLAVGDRDVAAVVHDADVAGVQPAVRVDRVRRRLRVLVVALHHVVAADDDLARLAARRPRCCPSSTMRTSVSGIAHPDVFAIVSASSPSRHIDTDAGRLGEPVRGEDRLERELAAHPLDQLDGDGRRAGHRETQRRQIVSRSGALRIDWYSVGGPGSIVMRSSPMRRSTCRHVEDRVRDDRRAAHQARDEPGLVPERVEERVDDQVAVAFAQADEARPHLEDAQRLRVRRHDALRTSGRPGREHDVAQVVRVDRVRRAPCSCAIETASEPRM